MNSDYSGPKTWVASPGNFFADRNGDSPSWLILHGTAGGTSAVGIAHYLNSVNLSVHYIIDQAGNIVQMVHEADGAYGNGIIDPGCDPWWTTGENPNNRTISIEHCKVSTNNSDQLTEAQKQASFKLVADICQRNSIPTRKADANGGITGHYSIEPINRKDCPGPYPWDELFAYLQHNGGSVAPAQNQYETNANIKKEFDDCWDSTGGHLFNNMPPPNGTGIFKSWVAGWLAGHQFGPPITFEYQTINGVGQSLIVQQFAGARCEWLNGEAHWYTPAGEITF